MTGQLIVPSRHLFQKPESELAEDIDKMRWAKKKTHCIMITPRRGVGEGGQLTWKLTAVWKHPKLATQKSTDAYQRDSPHAAAE